MMIGGILIFWVILISLSMLLVRGLFKTNNTNATNQPASARQILEVRYARGEINKEQYLLMMRDIQH